MGNLTDDMTRLRGEVDALRSARGALMQDLTRGAKDLATVVAAMRADFTSAQAAMAKQARGERETFVSTVVSEVNSLLGAFSRGRDQMARKGRHDRGVFLSEMRRQVAGMCKDTADDLMGVRLAWSDRSPGKSRSVPMKKGPVAVKPVSPQPEAGVVKKTAATPVIDAERPPVTFKVPLKKQEAAKMAPMPVIETVKPPVVFKEPPKKEEETKTVAAPVIETKKPPVAFTEPPKKEGETKRIAAAFEPPAAVEPAKGKALPPVSASMPPFQKNKEKRWPDEKPAKPITRLKRGRK